MHGQLQESLRYARARALLLTHVMARNSGAIQATYKNDRGSPATEAHQLDGPLLRATTAVEGQHQKSGVFAVGVP